MFEHVSAVVTQVRNVDPTDFRLAVRPGSQWSNCLSRYVVGAGDDTWRFSSLRAPFGRSNGDSGKVTV
jgi:hypothetical protein